MTRNRLATTELAGVLDLLDEVQKASAASVSAAAQKPPPKPPPMRRKGATDPSQLFATVRVEGEDQLGRASGEEKVAILRRKTRALEDRLRDIRDAWGTIETEAKQDAAQEKQRREEAEERVNKLNAFLLEKKREFQNYEARVLSAIQELTRREQQALEEHARREREALQEHSRHQQEALEEQENRERSLRERAERAERKLTELKNAPPPPAPSPPPAPPPPPPPPLTAEELEEVTRAIADAGRGIANILQGRVSDNDGVEILRKVLRQLKAMHKQLDGALRDLS